MFYIGQRDNAQLKTPYYKAFGKLTKKDAKAKEQCAYGSMWLTGYKTEAEGDYYKVVSIPAVTTTEEFLDAVKADTKTLVVLNTPDKDNKEARDAYKKVVKSAANIKGVATTNDNQLNVYDLLKYEKCIMVKDAVATIEEVYA